MKRIHLFLLAALTGLGIFASCNKKQGAPTPIVEEEPQNTAAKGGSGSGNGGGGGGGNTSTGPLQNVLSGVAARHVSGGTDSIFVSFGQPAPAGWVLSVSTSNSAVVTVPATKAVPAGAYNVYIPFTTTTVASTISVSFSVSLGGQTKSTSISVFPLHATFPAPQLQSPSSGTQLRNRTIGTFTSNSNANAYLYQLQMSTNTSFSPITTELDIQLETPLWRQSAFNSAGIHYWRMRFVDGSGNGGPWSAVRNFDVE